MNSRFDPGVVVERASVEYHLRRSSGLECLSEGEVPAFDRCSCRWIPDTPALRIISEVTLLFPCPLLHLFPVLLLCENFLSTSTLVEL